MAQPIEAAPGYLRPVRPLLWTLLAAALTLGSPPAQAEPPLQQLTVVIPTDAQGNGRGHLSVAGAVWQLESLTPMADVGALTLRVDGAEVLHASAASGEPIAVSATARERVEVRVTASRADRALRMQLGYRLLASAADGSVP